jgi:Na+/H+ antiporter NhaD/arsenite permease-like protein
MFKIFKRKKKKCKVALIFENEVDDREKNDNHNVSASKRKILNEIELLVIEEGDKKQKIGRHQYWLLALVVFLVIFPLFFLSFLIPLVSLVGAFILYYKSDKREKKYIFEHKFWVRMFKHHYGV